MFISLFITLNRLSHCIGFAFKCPNGNDQEQVSITAQWISFVMQQRYLNAISQPADVKHKFTFNAYIQHPYAKTHMQNSANYVIISCFVFNRASCSKQLSQGGICALIFHLPLTSSWVTVPPPFRVSDWELAASIFLRLADLVLFTTHRCLR